MTELPCPIFHPKVRKVTFPLGLVAGEAAKRAARRAFLNAKDGKKSSLFQQVMKLIIPDL